jgi:hypothetical protein
MKNERIQEFILQCTETVPFVNEDSGITHHREFFDHEKFAELIVRECAMLVEGFILEQEVALDDYQEYEASAVLKEHFGVEE